MNKSELLKNYQKFQETKFTIWSTKAIFCWILWYFFSFVTLFLNKYILMYQSGDPVLLGSFQLLMCLICGYFHLKVPVGLSGFGGKKSLERSKVQFSNFTRDLTAVGSLRFSTLLLGLVALWYVPVSFAETVKSSAPVFTVIITRLLLGERTTCLVNMSLIPVMLGLALCSAYELSFTLIGFIASLLTNISECLQNVYSKKLLSVERYEPQQIQFYTSAASFIIQVPCIIMLVDFSHVWHALTEDTNFLLALILNGVSFHFQSMTEYMLLTTISPVTHSVANTVKRALLIWASVFVFGNPVTFLSWIGTGVVIFGVLMYNKARSIDAGHESGNSHSV